jgi:hypothetical protein
MIALLLRVIITCAAAVRFGAGTWPPSEFLFAFLKLFRTLSIPRAPSGCASVSGAAAAGGASLDLAGA